jgi:hypothetical protein
VGYVTDQGGNFPLVETYTAGTWVPSVAPLPQGYANDGSRTTIGALNAVSCPAAGTCAAVGDYLDPGGYQNALLETLSAGTWTAVEGARASGSPGGLLNIRSVSCADTTTCVATGDYAYGDSYLPLVYGLATGSWHLQAAPPLPSDYAANLELSSAACPDATDCRVVGSYGDSSLSSHGMVLTDTAGTWSPQQVSLPADADNEPGATGLRVLDAVDCADAANCLAGGAYVDTAGNTDPLLVTLQSGTWASASAPVPSDAQTNPAMALVTAISCPSMGSCVADGIYLNTSGQLSGMLLSQSGSSWSAASAPVPGTYQAGTRSPRHRSALQGVSCTRTHFCRAVGDFGPRPLIEKKRTVVHR